MWFFKNREIQNTEHGENGWSFKLLANTDAINLWRRISTATRWLSTHTGSSMQRTTFFHRGVPLNWSVNKATGDVTQQVKEEGLQHCLCLGVNRTNKKDFRETGRRQHHLSSGQSLQRKDGGFLSVQVTWKGQRIKVDCLGNFLKKITFLHLRRF